MDQFITTVKTDLNSMLKTSMISDGLLMAGDNLANRIVVELYRDGIKIPIDPTDTIMGYIIRADGYTVDARGSVDSDGNAVLDIPALACAVEGQASVTIRVFSSNKRIAIAVLNCFVRRAATYAVINEETYNEDYHIPSVDEIIAYFDMIDQKELANEIAENERKSAERGRVTAEQLRVVAEQERVLAENNRSIAEVRREQEHSASLATISGMTIDSETLSYDQEATSTLSTVNGHKHIHLGLPTGAPFRIRRTFSSIQEMNEYAGNDVIAGDFVIISSLDNADEEDDADNAKLYLKTANGYQFIVNLSGSQGFKGEIGPPGPKGDPGEDGGFRVDFDALTETILISPLRQV